MLNKQILRRKVKLIYEDIEKLRPLGDLTYKEVAKDYFKWHTAERLLERIITRAIDINRHTIAEIGTGAEKVRDHFDSFIAMGQLGVIPKALAKKIAPSTSLRNRLVHNYNDTDDRTVFNSIGDALKQYTLYCDAILTFIDQPPGKGTDI